nr:efflux RND transporter periplasmic adaptor subunit [uncultured Massilia sp.]
MKCKAKRPLVAVAAGLAIAAGGIWLAAGGQSASAAKAQAPAVEVKTEAAVGRAVRDWREYVGRLEAVERVDVRPRVAGTIAAVHFRDGDMVSKGSLLFTIDPAPYEAELRQVEAALAMAEDRRRLADTEFARARRLLDANAIARREFDALESAAMESASAVRAAQAAVVRARLDLGYTRIVAPISGRVSRAEITAGNVVSAGGDAAVLTTIVASDPVYASFNVDEQAYLRFLDPDSRDRQPVRLGLADEDGYPRAGVVHSVDNRLDVNSGTIRVRARFPNADGRMVPGMQARVKVEASVLAPAVLVDEAAIGIDQDRKFVLVVGADDRVEYRAVELGGRQGSLRVVRSGVAAGERVIVDGGQRVKPGDAVVARPVVAAR